MDSEDRKQKVMNLLKNLIGGTIVVVGIIVVVLGYLSQPYVSPPNEMPEVSESLSVAYQSFPVESAAVAFLGGFIIMAGFLVSSMFSGERSKMEWVYMSLICAAIMIMVSAVAVYMFVETTWTGKWEVVWIPGGRGVEMLKWTPSVNRIYAHFSAILGIVTIVLVFTALSIKSRM